MSKGKDTETNNKQEYSNELTGDQVIMRGISNGNDWKGDNWLCFVTMGYVSFNDDKDQ